MTNVPDNSSPSPDFRLPPPSLEGLQRKHHPPIIDSNMDHHRLGQDAELYKHLDPSAYPTSMADPDLITQTAHGEITPISHEYQPLVTSREPLQRSSENWTQSGLSSGSLYTVPTSEASLLPSHVFRLPDVERSLSAVHHTFEELTIDDDTADTARDDNDRDHTSLSDMGALFPWKMNFQWKDGELCFGGDPFILRKPAQSWSLSARSEYLSVIQRDLKEAKTDDDCGFVVTDPVRWVLSLEAVRASMLERWDHIFWSKFEVRMAAKRKQGTDTSGANSGAIGPSTGATPSSGSSNTQSRHGHKRRKAIDGPGSNDDDDQDDNGDRANRQSMENSLPAPARAFACPFIKWRPQEFQDRCLVKLRTISHVKTHLLTKHNKTYCDGCSETVDQDEPTKMAQHYFRCSGRTPSQSHCITAEARAKIEKRPYRMNSEKRWRYFFTVLFPGEEYLPDPYWDTIFDSELRFLEWCLQDHGRLPLRQHWVDEQGDELFPKLDVDAQIDLVFRRWLSTTLDMVRRRARPGQVDSTVPEIAAQLSSGDGESWPNPSHDETFSNSETCFRPRFSDPFRGYDESELFQESSKEHPTGSKDEICRPSIEDWTVGLEARSNEYDRAPSFSNPWDTPFNEVGLSVRANPHSQTGSNSFGQEFGEFGEFNGGFDFVGI